MIRLDADVERAVAFADTPPGCAVFSYPCFELRPELALTCQRCRLFFLFSGTSFSGAFRSPYQSEGYFSHTFDTVGVFPYHCTPHPGMDGTVTVEPAPARPAVVLDGPTATAVAAAIAGGVDTYRRCAGEGGVCACTSTIRYGVGSDWAYADPSPSGQTSCSTAVLGDPKPNAHKGCHCLHRAPSTNPTIRDVVVSSYRDATGDVRGHLLQQQGGQCASTSSEAEHFFGYMPSVGQCAEQCRRRLGCTLFRYHAAALDCRQQGAPDALDCGPGGVVASAYDSYRLDDAVDATAWSLAEATIGSHVEAAGACWRHSHPNEGSVYDFSRWAISHPGNVVLSKYHKYSNFDIVLDHLRGVSGLFATPHMP